MRELTQAKDLINVNSVELLLVRDPICSPIKEPLIMTIKDINVGLVVKVSKEEDC